MKQYAEADKPAIYRSMRINGVQVKKYTGGHPYVQNGMFMRSSLAKPIYSYAKNFTKFKKDFSLFIWTTEYDVDRIENLFDGVVKNLKRQQIVEVLNNIKPFSYVEPHLV